MWKATIAWVGTVAERGPNDSSTCARKKVESERSFFIVHLQFVLVLASLFISTLFGDARFRRNLALGPLFVNAHKIYLFLWIWWDQRFY